MFLLNKRYPINMKYSYNPSCICIRDVHRVCWTWEMSHSSHEGEREKLQLAAGDMPQLSEQIQAFSDSSKNTLLLQHSVHTTLSFTDVGGA